MRPPAGANDTWRAAGTMSTPQSRRGSGRPADIRRSSVYRWGGTAMSESTTAGSRPAEPGAATQDPAIRPFQVSIPDEDLVEVRRRIDAPRGPEREHVRSQHEDALPLIVTHGWPGSIIEQLKIIGPLTDP